MGPLLFWGVVLDKPDHVFLKAAELFGVLSAPMRLRIINCLRSGELSVTQLLGRVETTQPNMSQHLNTLYRAGILGKRRDGAQVMYRIVDERVQVLCQAICSQIAEEQPVPTPTSTV